MDIGVDECPNVPFFIVVGFLTNDRLNDTQDQNNSLSDRLPIKTASSKIVKVRYLDNEMQMILDKTNTMKLTMKLYDFIKTTYEAPVDK